MNIDDYYRSCYWLLSVLLSVIPHFIFNVYYFFLNSICYSAMFGAKYVYYYLSYGRFFIRLKKKIQIQFAAVQYFLLNIMNKHIL